ncbi:hypothetical protein D9619_005103 [Psilocybe cf. subviscida]|uniref:Uncharacterized protein n=1 Tax=Psilocybe cf. subviscida TaxID=2480587 RepID=A0A8H5BP53_9AGAR|nr:hypothetical protein D9619_005103 [Psilocybe cf. subviscida]
MLGTSLHPAMLQNPGSAHSTNSKPVREWGNCSRLRCRNNLLRYACLGDLPRECFGVSGPVDAEEGGGDSEDS